MTRPLKLDAKELEYIRKALMYYLDRKEKDLKLYETRKLEFGKEEMMKAIKDIQEIVSKVEGV